MKELQLKGTQEFLGMNIPVIEGGFGEGQKVMLAKTIAEIHGMELKEVNKLINNNFDEFIEGVDILDLSPVISNNQSTKEILLNSGYSKRGITATMNQEGNFYLLSEQGYFNLVMFMRTEKAKEIRKQLRREYFAMREVINADEQLKSQLLLNIYNGGHEGVLATKKLVEIETKGLVEVIEEQAPKVEGFETFMETKNDLTWDIVAKNLGVGRNKMLKALREKKILF